MCGSYGAMCKMEELKERKNQENKEKCDGDKWQGRKVGGNFPTFGPFGGMRKEKNKEKRK